jgi:adenosylcobinamide-GDP ribazoletransferase
MAALIGVTACVGTGLPLPGPGLAFPLASLAALGVARLAWRRIGGQTGDVVGAAQQVAEVAALTGLLLAAPA